MHWTQVCTGGKCALEAGVLETGLHCMQVCTEVGVHWSQMCTRDRCLPVAGVHWMQVCPGGRCALGTGVA